MGHWPDLTWVCQWRQVAEEEVHLCRVAAVGHHLYFFFTASAMWGKQQGGIFIRWRVIGLGLWVQIGTADEGKCRAVDAVWMSCC